MLTNRIFVELMKNNLYIFEYRRIYFYKKLIDEFLKKYLEKCKIEYDENTYSRLLNLEEKELEDLQNYIFKEYVIHTEVYKLEEQEYEKLIKCVDMVVEIYDKTDF